MLAGWCAAALLAGPAAAQTADLPPLRPLSMVSAEAALARLPGAPTPAPRTSGTLDLRGRQVHIAEYLLLFDLAGEQPGPVRDGKLLGTPVPEGKAQLAWRATPDVAVLQALTDHAWADLQARLQAAGVVLADAALEIQKPEWNGTVDALAVDLYDHDAAAPVLDSADFYADCRALLTEDGCLTVNLFGRSSSYERSLDKLAEAFGDDALWAFKATREGNTVVLAQRTPTRPKRAELLARAEVIQERWGLPATKWLRVFKPVA